MKHGFRNATGDIIVTLDADGSTNPEQIPEFVYPLSNGYDFAKGSRFLKINPNHAFASEDRQQNVSCLHESLIRYQVY